MKKLLIFSAILPVLFMACAEEPLPPVEPPAPTPEEAEIKIDVTSIVIPAEGGSETIRFNSSQKWEAEVKSSQDNSWCTISPKSGAAGDASVTITAKASNDVNSRTAILTIKSGKIKKAINVSQKQKDALTVTSSVFEVDAEGGDISITVKANIEFEYMISDECAEWISFTGTKAMTTHNLSFAIASNDETKSRQGKITIYSGSLQEEITIKQKGKEISYEEVWAKEREILMNFYTATGGDNWTDNTNWGSALPVSEWYGIRTDEDGMVIDICLYSNNLTGTLPEGLSGLERLSQFDIIDNHLTGSIPAELGQLSNITLLYFEKNEFSGSIPPELGNLSHLNYLELANNQLTGSIPPELGRLSELERLSLFNNFLSGSIPPEIGNMSSLAQLYLYGNSLTGSIPAELAELNNLRECVLWGNQLSGVVPEALREHPCWETNWHLILHQSNYRISYEGLEIYAPEFSVRTIDGGNISNEIFAQNKYTVLYHFLDWCGFSEVFTPRLVAIYDMFKDLGLGAFSVSSQSDDAAAEYVKKHRIPWPCTTNQKETGTFINYIDRSPTVAVFDSDGKVVFSSALSDYGEIAAFFTEKLGSPNGTDASYNSTDYSKDGDVRILQKASKGNGIDIILIGDGYSDRLIADGTYDKTMDQAMELFFKAEPYKTHRDMFNVYAVTAVSQNEVYATGTSTAVEGYFGSSMHVGGNDAKAMEYALKAISDDKLNDALIIVMMNSTAFAGTCYMYDPVHSAELDYFGNGTSVAYFPVGVNEEALEQLIRHEAGGHGFAKLADEYAYRNNGAIPYFKVAETEAKEEFGWWKNIDFTNNPSDVKWSGFINDERYSDEGIGVFEGGLTYWMGVYRPTEDSAMNSGIGGYNAPSREAIYYRIHKLAYGQSWEYDRNDFIKYDLDCKTPQTRSVNIVNSSYDLPAPPVITGKTWKERMNDR